jgi:hypothetical protein
MVLYVEDLTGRMLALTVIYTHLITGVWEEGSLQARILRQDQY